MSGYPEGPGKAPPQLEKEKKGWFGMRRSTVVLSALMLLLLAGIAAVGAIFGTKIGDLESKLDPTK